MAKSRYEVEKMILAMASIVMENRALSEEVKELRVIRDKYYNSINERAMASEEVTRSMIGIVLKGSLDNTQSSNDVLLELVDCMHVEL